MIRGKVIGTVWGARKVPPLTARRLVLVSELEGGEPTGRVVVAIDPLNAESGREVVVSFGSAARLALDAKGGRGVFADAAVTHIVEGATC